MNRLIPALLLSAASFVVNAGSGIEVSEAWVREAPPGAPMIGAFMTLTNTGDKDVRLVDVESPAFAHVMLHKTEMVDGVARMLHQDDILIPANGRVALEPGSYHLMMPAPDTRLSEGDQVEFLLHLDNDYCIRIQAPVKKKP
jgi:copper(I)-binding protein